MSGQLHAERNTDRKCPPDGAAKRDCGCPPDIAAMRACECPPDIVAMRAGECPPDVAAMRASCETECPGPASGPWSTIWQPATQG